MAEDCLFCKIVAREIPSSTVLERDDIYAFRDIVPAAPVHVLVVPKEHVRDATVIGPEHGAILTAMFDAANEVARIEGIDGSGYRLILNVGPDAGQTVFHLHLHVVGGAPLGAVAST